MRNRRRALLDLDVIDVPRVGELAPFQCSAGARSSLTKLGGAPLPCGGLAGRVKRALKERQPRTERCR